MIYTHNLHFVIIKYATTITNTTKRNEPLIAHFKPLRSLSKTLNSTKLIVKEMANILIANINCMINKQISPATKQRFDAIIIRLIIFDSISLHPLNFTYITPYHILNLLCALLHKKRTAKQSQI